MRTTYRKIGDNRYEVFVNHGMTKEMVGIVYLDFHKGRGKKWAIEAHFMSLFSDYTELQDLYFDSVEAGRALVKIWARVEAASSREITSEYNIDHLFGSD
jgi:hypothetical protein